LIGPAIAHASRHQASRVAAFVLLGAVLVGACGNPPSPSPNGSGSASGSPSSSLAVPSGPPNASPTETACVGADIQAGGGPWGGAAGSRGVDILIENRGIAACLLPAGPTVALVDAHGAVVLSTPARAGPGPSVAPNGTAGFSLVFSNWCLESVELPLHVRLALAGDAVDIESLIIASVDELPPCNGPGQPAVISTTDWQPD
jgi:hypothetical protein